MCGRYRVPRHKQILAERFDVGPDDDWEPRYNIGPTQTVPVIRQHPAAPKRMFSSMKCGLILYWSRDASVGGNTFNARAETVAEKNLHFAMR